MVDAKELARLTLLLNAAPAKSKKGHVLTQGAKDLVAYFHSKLPAVSLTDFQNHLDGKVLLTPDKSVKASWLSRRLQEVTDAQGETILAKILKTGKDAKGATVETLNAYAYLEPISEFLATLPGAKAMKENGVYCRVA